MAIIHNYFHTVNILLYVNVQFTASMYIFVGTFNTYVELTGCTSTRHPSSLSDDTPLLHLLSYSTENESSNDLLYAVICDVVRIFTHSKLHIDCTIPLFL